MDLPFVGSAGQEPSENGVRPRTLNLFLELRAASTRGKLCLRGTPGLILRQTLGGAPIRGGIRQGDYAYVVAGDKVYRIDSLYAATLLGSIGTATGHVGLATNGTETIIVDGVAGWLCTGAAIAQITDADFPNGVTQAECQDGFFIVCGDGSGRFYWNATPNVGSGWDGLDFASVEGDPDKLVAVKSNQRELWFIGTDSAEVYVNTGDSDQPFQRSGNVFLNVGTAAPWSVQTLDNTVFWLGRNENGEGVVFKAEGYTPRRISNHAIERLIAAYATISDAFGFSYAIEGHAFYVLSFPTANVTWVYDASIQDPELAWHEWSYRHPNTNTDNRHRASCCFFFGREHVVGDWESGALYALSLITYTDAGDPIRRQRVIRVRTPDAQAFGMLDVDIEKGVGDVGTDPKVMLDWLDLDRWTPIWSAIREMTFGGPGRGGRVRCGPLGMSADRAWRLTITDAAKVTIYGARVETD
jgi:hypothetical protein